MIHFIYYFIVECIYIVFSAANLTNIKKTQTFKEAPKGFSLLSCLWNNERYQRTIFHSVGKIKNIFATLLLGNTLRALMTSYELSWQHARSTKQPSKFQFLQIIWKIKSLTYHFYFFVGNLPKLFNFLESMTKSYLVELTIHWKKAFYSLQKIVLNNFPRNFFHIKCHREWYMPAKNQDRSPSKISR